MSNRSLKITCILVLMVSCGLMAFTWHLGDRARRETAATVARYQASRAKMQVLLDREHAESVEIKALLEILLGRLDGVEPVRPGRVWRESGERRVD